MAAKRRLIQPLLVVMLLLGAFAALAGSQVKAPSAGSPSGAAKAPAPAAPPPASAADGPPADVGVAAVLTRRLTGATGVTDAVAATREALALGGLSTREGQRFLVKAAAPAASGFVISVETVALAMEARQRPTAGRLTLAQLGDMLEDLGWPFPEGRVPGEQLRDIFRAWVTDGLAQPGDLLSFTPLFLREMALTQQPAIDLAKGDYDPEQLHLTLLELELFAAHFNRISGAATPASRAPAKGDPELELLAAHVDRVRGPAVPASWHRVSGLDLEMPAAQAPAGPCPEIKKWLDSAFGDFGDPGQAAEAAVRILISDNVKAGLKEALQAAGFSAAAAQQFGKALSALSIASRLWKLLALYTDAQVAVTVEQNPIHAPSGSEGKKTDVFRARAGVSDRDWQEYTQAMASSDDVRGLRDCFRVFGLPVLPDLGDMAKEAKDWHVEWRLQGAPERVRINVADNTFSRPGFLRTDLKPDGDYSAAAPLTVEILPERGQTHSGPEKQAIATASAALHTAKPPSIGTWVNAVRGGLGNIMALSNALVELCAGWIAEMAPPKAYASLTVAYHESAGVSWSGRITYKKIRMADEPESSRDRDGHAFTLYHAEYWSEANTVEVSGGSVQGKTQLEEIWDMRGFSTVLLTEEHLTDNWHEDDGCKAKEVATSHERSYSVMNAGGTGPMTGNLTISNDGTYQLNFLSPPEAKGETVSSYDSWWENKPCVEDERHTQSSDPKSGHGPGISVAGKLDPKKPGVLKGHYEVKEPGGYTVTVTWNLRQNY